MPESPDPPSTEAASELLSICRAQLQALADASHDELVPPDQQLQAENAVAAGVAELASEPPPEPATESPTRPILATDLLITVDLVLRALESPAR